MIFSSIDISDVPPPYVVACSLSSPFRIPGPISLAGVTTCVGRARSTGEEVDTVPFGVDAAWLHYSRAPRYWSLGAAHAPHPPADYHRCRRGEIFTACLCMRKARIHLGCVSVGFGFPDCVWMPVFSTLFARCEGGEPNSTRDTFHWTMNIC